MRHLLLAVIVAGCTGCNVENLTSNGTVARTSSPNAEASPAAPVHSVTGTGLLKVGQGLEFATTVAVHQDATGRVWGRVVTHIIDLNGFGITTSGELIQEPVCMRVVGNTAYISMVTVKTFDERVSKVGDKGVFWVKDGGKDGDDVGFGGPAFFWDPTNAICTSTPPQLPAVPVAKGNFRVE